VHLVGARGLAIAWEPPRVMGRGCSWRAKLVGRSMATASRWVVLRVCFFGAARDSLTDRIAVLAMWCFTLAVLLFNALFGRLLPDANLLIRGFGTLVLSAPLALLYARGKRMLLNRITETAAPDSHLPRL
jgi:hypothetical protein